MSGPHVEDGSPLSGRMVAYYRDLLAGHDNDPVKGLCPICAVSRCQDWRFAWSQLVSAGELEEPHQASLPRKCSPWAAGRGWNPPQNSPCSPPCPPPARPC